MIGSRHPGSVIFVVAVLLAACGGGQRPLPLTVAERCAQNGLILDTAKGAQVSGVAGKFFGGDGSAHSCARPSEPQHHCEVQGHSQSAVVKQTQQGDEAQVLAYANQVRWHYYNHCMQQVGGGQPGAPAQPVVPAQPTGQPPPTSQPPR